jgi:hypothetical protein
MSKTQRFEPLWVVKTRRHKWRDHQRNVEAKHIVRAAELDSGAAPLTSALAKRKKVEEEQ